VGRRRLLRFVGEVMDGVGERNRESAYCIAGAACG
jgi:hypothetical protein